MRNASLRIGILSVLSAWDDRGLRVPRFTSPVFVKFVLFWRSCLGWQRFPWKIGAWGGIRQKSELKNFNVIHVTGWNSDAHDSLRRRCVSPRASLEGQCRALCEGVTRCFSFIHSFKHSVAREFSNFEYEIVATDVEVHSRAMNEGVYKRIILQNGLVYLQNGLDKIAHLIN